MTSVDNETLYRMKLVLQEMVKEQRNTVRAIYELEKALLRIAASLESMESNIRLK